MDRNALPREADNYDVWCERCRRVHRHYSFTQEDYDRMVVESAARLQEAIDAHLIKLIYLGDPV